MSASQWQNDEELFRFMTTTLYTPVVGDILDGLGRYHQFLPQAIRPLRDDFVMAGRAMPVQIAEVQGPPPQPFGKMIEALDQLRPGEVYLASQTPRCASWGEIMTAAARARGARGAVINGFHRDTPKVLEQDWPVFSRGAWAQDAAARAAVVDFRCPIEIEGVTIESGDLVFGDIDGVVVVPRDLEREVIAQALEKARAEKTVRLEIERGASVRSVFEKHGVL